MLKVARRGKLTYQRPGSAEVLPRFVERALDGLHVITLDRDACVKAAMLEYRIGADLCI
jgi:hypothetical protein